MSRSCRRSPVTGFACASSEVFEKRVAARKFRRRTKRAVSRDPDAAPRRMDEVSDPWNWGKDGRVWWGSFDRPWPSATATQARRLFKK